MASSSARKYDVFLSFRGEDTRSNFIGHLRNALIHKSIRIFIDDKLKRGEDVWEALAKAIEESNVSIVVFSENYASSSWCLNELGKILECREKLGQVVIPVFYEVDPSDIRNQTGNYEKAFAKHERDLGDEGTGSNKEKVLSWKTALTQAANISGWHYRIHRDESHVIENIVNDVLQKLHQLYPTELKGFVQTQENCTNVEILLKESRVIGIWGMGGIGKSAIAKILFAKLFPQFDHVCFVANAKEYSLDKLFSVLFKEEVYTSNVVGSTFDMRRLSSKKVFIVLDDVDKDSLHPFEYLCTEYDVLHPDSRLIITTRDKRLLEGKVDEVYKVKKWNKRESLELFCNEAFRKSCAPKGYERLSERAVKYAGCVPLALKVLGSHFHSKRNIKFWESTFRKLKKYPNQEIQNVLKVSYNGLDDLERKIFLDIAFFLKGKKKDHVTRILDACGFEATSGIEALEDKALITISNSNIILMHDLLKKMAFEIVRQECSGVPEKCSRLKDNEALEVIEENKGTGVIEGIALDLSQVEGLRLHADTLTKMKNLRFLKFYNTLGQSSSNTYLDLPETVEPFSAKLRYIEWIGYPFESLPSPFSAKFLVEIHMPHSKVKKIWQGIQELNNIESVQLSGCQLLEEVPDFSKAPRLKWVNLSCCESLQYLHPSILSSDTLVTLILDGCKNLKRVKGEKHLKSLKEISLNGCLSLEEFAVSSDLIENLDLSNTGIQTLDTSIGRMVNLKLLNLEGLRLGHPLKELSCLTSLKELKLSDSGQVIDKQQLHILFDGLRSLLKLHMKNMSNLFELPSNISVLSKLKELRLDGSNVERLPESIQNLEELEILSLQNCKELLCLPTLPLLIKYLGAINCSSLVSVSNLHTLATKMFGMTKFITFKNSLRLDGQSCKLIMESLQLTMMHAVFDNVISRYHDTHGYNYTSVELCLPGSRVPRKITHRTTESTISIELSQRSNLLGFMYSVVLSPAGGMKKHGSKVKSKCYLPENDMKEAWLSSDIGGLNSDHVYVWYDPFHCDSILNYHEQKVRFEFCVANDEGEVDGSICIKECGIQLVSVSDFPSFLEDLDWGLDKKQILVRLVESATGQNTTFKSIEQSDEDESSGMRNQTQNQPQNLSKHCSSDSIAGSESTTEMVETDSAEEENERKNNYPDVEESINFTHRETKSDSGTDCRQNIRESIDAVKDEGNKRMPIKPGATLHETVDSGLDKENESKEKSRPKPVMDELKSAEDHGRKGNFSLVGKSIGYTHKEIKNAVRSRESFTEYTEDVKNKGNKRTPVEPDANLHDPISESQLNTEYYESEDKSVTHSKLVVMVELESAKEDNGSNNYFSGFKESIESTCKETQQTTARRGPKEKSTKSKKVAKSKGNEGMTEFDVGLHPPIVSVNEENATKDKSKSKAEGEDGSDEDPFAELDSILLRSPKSSKATCSTTTTTDFAIREALHNLHCLLENSLESILSDFELQQQLHIALEYIEEASQEKVSPKVANLVEDMASSIGDLFQDFASTQKVIENHNSCLQQKQNLVQQVRDAKKWQELVNKEMSQCKFETECLDKEAEKLEEKIRCFVEQKKSVELKKVKLKETLERCEGEKKKLKHEAKNKVTESKEIMLVIEKSKALYDAALSKQQKLNNKWEGFRLAFADNCGTLVAHDSWCHQPELLIFLFFIINIILCYEGSEKHPHSGY